MKLNSPNSRKNSVMKSNGEAGWYGYIGAWLLAHFLANIPGVVLVYLWGRQGFETLSGAYTFLVLSPIIYYLIELPIIIFIYRLFKIVDKRKVVPWMYGITVLVGAFGIAQEVEYLPVFTSNFWIFMISGLLIGMIIKCLGFNWFFVWRSD